MMFAYLLCFRKILASNLVLQFGYPRWGFSRLLQPLQVEGEIVLPVVQSLYLSTSLYLCSLFISNPDIRCHIMLGIDSCPQCITNKKAPNASFHMLTNYSYTHLGIFLPKLLISLNSVSWLNTHLLYSSTKTIFCSQITQQLEHRTFFPSRFWIEIIWWMDCGFRLFEKTTSNVCCFFPFMW